MTIFFMSTTIANSYHIMQANQGQEVLDYIASRQADWIFFEKDPS